MNTGKAIKALVKMGLSIPGAELLPNLCRYHPFKYPVHKYIFPIFHGGETIEDLKNTTKKLNSGGISVIADYVTEHETRGEYYRDKNLNAILALIDSIGEGSGVDIPMISVKLTSIIHPQTLVQPQTLPNWNLAIPLEQICEAAAAKHIKVLIDAEESKFRKTTHALGLEVQRSFNSNNGEGCLVYSTYQAYFSLSPEILLNHVARAKKERFVLGAKIVRGAYLDHERNHGSMTICDSINETHMNYNRMTRAAIEHMEVVSLIAATHNKESVKYIQKLMLDAGIENDDPSISFAQLYGVGDELTEEIRSSGHRVLKYVPYGPYSETIPYLFRRIKENVDIVSKI